MPTTTPRIGIAIPCYKYHIPVLQRCLDSIAAQTVQPDEVVVSCSSSLASYLPTYNYCFPLTIVVHSGRLNAAQNRNYAASKLTTDLISFFDADDEMHPQRIEAILSTYTKNPCSIIVHSYWMNEETTQPFIVYPIETIRWIPNCLQRAPSGCLIVSNHPTYRLHHSQATVTADVLAKVKFREGSDFERREDAVFCGDVVQLPDITTAYIMEPLSKYYFEGQWYESH